MLVDTVLSNKNTPHIQLLPMFKVDHAFFVSFLTYYAFLKCCLYIDTIALWGDFTKYVIISRVHKRFDTQFEYS